MIGYALNPHLVKHILCEREENEYIAIRECNKESIFSSNRNENMSSRNVSREENSPDNKFKMLNRVRRIPINQRKK